MLVAISRMVSKHGFARLSPDRFNRTRLLCLALLMPTTTICLPPLLLAQQNDVSVLVSHGSVNSAASNVAVELPQASSSVPTLKSALPTNRPFSPPLPPASLLEDSKTLNFRHPAKETLAVTTIAKSSVAQLERERSGSDHNAAIGTFTSQLRSDAGIQQQGAFGSSRAPAGLRSDHANGSELRNRFGDFGTSPDSNAGSRFAPISSSQRPDPNQPRSAAPIRSASNSFAAPAVAPAAAQQRIGPVAPSDRFKTLSKSATSSGFSSPAVSKAFPTQPKPPVSQPPVAAQTPFRPATNAQSLISPASRPSSEPFPARPEKFAAPVSSRPATPRSLGSSGQLSSGLGSPNTVSSLQSQSASPVIRRQTSSPSSQSSFGSLRNNQSNLVSSRSSSQAKQFEQPARQPLRGRPIDSELRGGASGQTSIAQSGSSLGRPSNKVDRQTIDFAQQQLRNIQSASVGENGTPVRLLEMFLEPISVGQRKPMVAQYWETYYDLAALKIANDYENWLSSITTSNVAEKGLLTAAQQMASDGQLAAKIQLGKSQSRLLDFMPNPRPNDFAPLPADEPLVEKYVTDYEKYKRVRSLPTSLRGIDPMLASTLELITRRAATVSTAKNAADQAAQAVRGRQIPLASAIAAGRIWRDSRLDMVASTVSYNQAISDFILTLESNRSPEQLTAFMLGAPKRGSQTSTTPARTQPTRSAANVQGWPQNQPSFR